MIEVHETYVRGRERNQHESTKLKAGSGILGEEAVLGIREWDRESVPIPVETACMDLLHDKISEHMETASMACTNERTSYETLEADGCAHGSVMHSAGEYVRANDICMNSAESVKAVYKRSLYRTPHHCSRKFLAVYIHDATVLLNQGNCKIQALGRLVEFADQAFRHRITYGEVTA